MPSSSTPVSCTVINFRLLSVLLLFAVIISHTLLKFNVQFNVLWNILVYNFLTPTQLLIYSSDRWADKRCCHSICLPYTLAQPFIFSYYGCQDNYMLQLLLMDPQLSVKHWLIEPWYKYHKEYSFEMNCLQSFLILPEHTSCGCNNPTCLKLQSMSVDVSWRNTPKTLCPIMKCFQ